MSKSKMKNDLRSQLIRVTIFPLIIMVIAISLIRVSTIYSSLVSQIKQELSKDTDLVIMLYDEVYSGQFNFSKGPNGKDVIIYKGSRVISGEDSMFEDLSDMLDIQISLFYQDTRILTTLCNEEGQKVVGTKAATVVVSDVLEKGQPMFYKDVTVYGEQYYAYYKPMIADDGTVYGMIGVCRPAQAIIIKACKSIWPVLLASVIMAAGVCMIMATYIKKITQRIKLIDIFLKQIAGGDFDVSIPSVINIKDDEIKKLAMDGKDMAKSLKNLVEYDALTELYNRRFGGNRLVDIKKRSDNTGMPFSISIGDIDFFKKVNDTYGHEMGDEVLKLVSNCLREGMKWHGYVARWGGEEFLLVFDGRDLEDAKRIALEILEEVRKIQIPTTEKYLTMSFGVTQAAFDEELDVILKRADDNLYEAKENGRNQVIAK